MDNKEISDLMFDYNKRKRMKETVMFKQTKECWDEGNYAESSKIGSILYIIRQAHISKTNTNPNSFLLQHEWTNYYITSGKKRNDILEQSNNSNYQTNEYYGRTLQDFYELAKQFQENLKMKYQIHCNIQAALNMVFIRVIDDSFLEYVRLMNVITKISKLNPLYKIEITPPLDCLNHAVDFIVYKDNNIIAAMKVLPESFLKKIENGKSNKQKDEYDACHQIFKKIYDIDVAYVYATIQGFIHGKEIIFS